ncbi:NnrS family protein [Pseudophaeobacter sp.]|uniref:NnrS family protein n=1 Tax=Pseudophaeobacter sp. TaxID=1971739 RepID=UPI003299D8AB
MANRDGIFHHLWDAPYRPLFLAAYFWAFVVVAVWPLGEAWGLPMPRLEPVVFWHIHELIFGFTAAAIGGYLLTALPNWAKTPPVHGPVLKILLMFWIVARVSIASADLLPLPMLAMLNAPFFLALAALILSQTLRAGAWAKVPFGLIVLCIGASDIAFLIALKNGHYQGVLDISHLALALVSLLVLIVGSRLIPAFTDNWLKQRADNGPCFQVALFSRGLAICLLVLFVGATLTGYPGVAGAFVALSGLVTLWNMRGWRSFSILRSPLLAGLHLAYFWLPLGLISLGTVLIFQTGYPISGLLHILTIGALSGLIIAVSGRAASHNGKGGMQASRFLVLGMGLIWFSTPVRVAAPMFPDQTKNLELISALIWCAGWAHCLIGFRPALIGEARRPVLSGTKHQTTALKPSNLKGT